jgi:Zn-dependent M28 family amino/carboxypeptidase
VKVVLAVVAVVAILAVVFVVVRRRARVAPQVRATPGLSEQLRRDVESLCAKGPRNTFVPASLAAAADFIERELSAAGFRVERQTFAVEQDGTTADNLIVEIPGASRAKEIVVIGAHYDSVDDSPGADDNASGVAALLALARRFAHEKPARTLRFVAFANEEPPHFQTETMGSLRYAHRCHERGETVVAMISLESLGYYKDAPGSQQYPPPLAALYPDRGNFLAFAGNLDARALVFQSARAFREATPFPAEAAVLPQLIQEVGWSDQWSFWQFGWPAMMITDTAPFRNPNYHMVSDLPDTLDYERLAVVTEGLVAVVRGLV